MHCVLIDRKSSPLIHRGDSQGRREIRGGIPMFVFPEGTRSKTGALGEFKSGSLKLATRAKAIVVPITIEGTRKALEQKEGIGRVVVHLSVADPIPTSELDEEQLKTLPETVYGAIQEQFRSLNHHTE